MDQGELDSEPVQMRLKHTNKNFKKSKGMLA